MVLHKKYSKQRIKIKAKETISLKLKKESITLKTNNQENTKISF